MLDMPRTDFAMQPDNAMAQLFYGKIAVERAVAYFYFSKGSDYRRLIHRIKYHGEKECGLYLGKMMVRELVATSTFEGIDYIVPVPLHRNKERKRCYNQSEWIAQGIADETGIPLCTDALVCRTHRESQTRKGVYDRYLATREAFELRPNSELQGSHVLIVDDVVTTGATLLSCGETLLKGGVNKVSMAVLSAAKI
jgi:ComF family protein